MEPKPLTQVHYYCPSCEHDFVVYHRNDDRNTHCAWCGNPVKLTGRVDRIEGEEIVSYQDGQEIGREPKKA